MNVRPTRTSHDCDPESRNRHSTSKGIIDETRRVSDIVKSLLQFSRQDKQSHSFAHIEDIIKCTRCGRCRALCPINEELGWESTNARGRMLLARALAEGEKPSYAMKRSFYTCLTCSMCTSTCPSGAKPDEVVEAARREMIAQGGAPPYYDAILENIIKHGNSLGDTGPRNAWVPEELRLNGKADVIYWAGCLTSYRQQQTALSNLKILSRFGARALDDEKCCGSPLLRLGGESVALEHNREQIGKAGQKPW